LRNGAAHEESPLAPIGPYVAAKAESERSGRAYFEARGLPFTVLRINAPYGPGQKTKTVLRRFIETALAGAPLRYHGSGGREQDFTYVDDVAEAIAASLRRSTGGTFNISAGDPVTMRELAERIVQVIPGCRSSVEPSGADDPQEGFRTRYSIERARVELGWQPQVRLADGVRRCIEELTKEENEARIRR
jgi:UDP-glucose 4-epimerase